MDKERIGPCSAFDMAFCVGPYGILIERLRPLKCIRVPERGREAAWTRRSFARIGLESMEQNVCLL